MVVSDIHLGTVVTKADLTKLSEHAEAIAPSGIILLGDIYDEGPPKMNLIIHYRYLKYWLVNTLFIILKGNHEIGFKVAHHLGNLILLRN